MLYAYLDWNVFNRIEKKDSPNEKQRIVLSKLEGMILDKKIICPYSNAHINDLLRGYAKNPIYIPKHLETIKRLTNNLCIVQYWGNTQTTWHYRDIEEFFESALEDSQITIQSFAELFDGDKTGRLEALRLTLVPKEFGQIYEASPIFNLMFPRTKTEMNALAMCEDLYDFSNNIKKDYSLYKSLRKFITQSVAILPNQRGTLEIINKYLLTPPPCLNFDEAREKYAPKTKTSENPYYQIITETYCKNDFIDFKSDDKFPNLIDDSLHAFYGAHCDYFITFDDRCHYKAIETFRIIGIATKVMSPSDFADIIIS